MSAVTLPPIDHDRLVEHLRAVDAAYNSPEISTVELPDTGSRKVRNRARFHALIALDRQRDWLQSAILTWPERPYWSRERNVFDKIRAELAAEGVRIDAADWLLTEDDL